MVDNLKAALSRRNYSEPEEWVAFIIAYGDGLRGEVQRTNGLAALYPNAYGAGYWEGVAAGSGGATTARLPRRRKTWLGRRPTKAYFDREEGGWRARWRGKLAEHLFVTEGAAKAYLEICCREGRLVS